MRPAEAEARAKAERLDALTRLGIARRERLDRADFDVYLGELERVPSGVVAEACRRLARTAPAEFEPRFPPLARVLAECTAVAEERRRRAELALPPRDEQPAAPERWAQLIEDCKAAVARGHDLNHPERRRES